MFFGELLGWTYIDTGVGHTVRAGGHSIGALFDLAGPNTPTGTPPIIGVMVKVENADAVCQTVTAAGGKARAAFDIGDAGRMAVCHDPAGAEFDVWEPKKLQGTDVDTNASGAPTWFENMTTDVARAAGFYAAAFGWTPEPAGQDDRLLKHLSRPVAGVSRSTVAGAQPHWATYFAVCDAERITHRAIELGATVSAKNTRFSGVRSPQGVAFYILQRGA